MKEASAESWLERCREQVNDERYRLLARAQATLLGNMEPPAGHTGQAPWHPLRGIRPDPSSYPGVWNWDAAFHAVAVSRWDGELAREQICILLGAQQRSGLLPDCLLLDGPNITAFGKPPVMPWAAMIVDQRAPDDRFLSLAYERFVLYEGFWRRERGGDADGLFHYDCGYIDDAKRRYYSRLEAGWDNSVRWDKASYSLWPIDLNCYMVMLYRALAYMARRLRASKDCERWRSRERELAERINSRLFDEQSACYLDFDTATARFSEVVTPASLMPLYVGIASHARAEHLAALAADPCKLYPGLPVVAYDHPEYRSDSYWRGPTWLNVAYFALKGLKLYGYTATAEAGRELMLKWCAQNEDALYEYYDSRSGKGLGAPHYSWTAAFVIEFILGWNE